MPPVHKQHWNCWFHALFGADIRLERLDRSIVAICNCLICDSEDSLDVVKYIALNGDPELLFAFVLDLPQWIWHNRNLVEFGNNIYYVIVFADELFCTDTDFSALSSKTMTSAAADSTFSGSHSSNFSKRVLLETLIGLGALERLSLMLVGIGDSD